MGPQTRVACLLLLLNLDGTSDWTPPVTFFFPTALRGSSL
jgi:hypothetical protein